MLDQPVRGGGPSALGECWRQRRRPVLGTSLADVWPCNYYTAMAVVARFHFTPERAGGAGDGPTAGPTDNHGRTGFFPTRPTGTGCAAGRARS